MSLALGAVFGGAVFPLAAFNGRLDSLPTTPLSAVQPGNSYKVFATVAPNQTDVVYGYYQEQTWTWIARAFWLDQGGTELLVNTSSLVEVRPPGTTWTSETGTLNYSAGSLVAVYGNAVLAGNSTILRAQYISSDPGAMGKLGGDLWSTAVVILLASGACAVGGWLMLRRQVRDHSELVASSLPQLPAAPPTPRRASGTVSRFEDGSAATRSRQATRMLIAGPPSLAAGLALLATDLLVPVFVGIFLAMLGGFFIFIGASMRVGRFREQLSVSTDDSGVWVEPAQPKAYPEDTFFAWGDVANFWVRSYGRFGTALLVRTARGEFVIGSFSDRVVHDLTVEFARHGVPREKVWTYQPSFRFPRVG